MVTLLLAALASGCPPRVERRVTMAKTDFCAPVRYNMPRWKYSQDAPSPRFEARNAATDSPRGLFVDGVLVADPRPEWGPLVDPSARFPSPLGVALADGRWLLQMEDMSPLAVVLQERHWPEMLYALPDLAYLFDPATGVATFVGRGFWRGSIPVEPPIDDFFLLVRGEELVFADVDPDVTRPALRPLGVYTRQAVVGHSAGTAVLWQRTGDIGTVSCLGTHRESKRRVTLPDKLEPANADAIRDQRVLLQGPLRSNRTTTDLWILDLDRARIRFIGMAPITSEGEQTASFQYRSWSASHAAWTGTKRRDEEVFLGWAITYVDPATERITPPARW